MIGFGIIIPILPFYIESFGGGGFSMGMLMSIFAAMQFVFAPVWGSLSDRIGRKPVLLLGILGNALAMLLMGLSNSLWLLFSSRALAGILSSATQPTAMAFISDSTSEKDRGGGMGIIGAAMGIGMVLGPGLGGLLSGISLSTPFYLAAGLSLLAAVLAWLFLPESLSPGKHTVTSEKGRPQLYSLLEAMKGSLKFLLILAFLTSFALTNFESVFGLYAARRFNYDADTVGLVLTFIGLVSAIVQGALTGPATRKFGDENVVKASLIGSAVGFAILLMAKNLPGVILTSAIFIFSNAMVRPGVSTLVSKRATTGQGVALGLSNSFMSLGRILGPLLAGFLLDINLSFPYMTGALLMLVGFISSLVFLQKDFPV